MKMTWNLSVAMVCFSLSMGYADEPADVATDEIRLGNVKQIIEEQVPEDPEEGQPSRSEVLEAMEAAVEAEVSAEMIETMVTVIVEEGGGSQDLHSSLLALRDGNPEAKSAEEMGKEIRDWMGEGLRGVDLEASIRKALGVDAEMAPEVEKESEMEELPEEVIPEEPEFKPNDMEKAPPAKQGDNARKGKKKASKGDAVKKGKGAKSKPKGKKGKAKKGKEKPQQSDGEKEE